MTGDFVRQSRGVTDCVDVEKVSVFAGADDVQLPVSKMNVVCCRIEET